MYSYVILTDSACDLSYETLKSWNVELINLTFRFDGDDKEYSNDEMNISDFYNRMKNGATAKTSAINPNQFETCFEKYLSAGSDVLYLGFSSGLSTTFNSACIAAEDLKTKYPDHKVVCVDSLAASAGQGMLVYLASERKKSGADILDVANYIKGIRNNLCHWFTVDDLVYLKRGGRISPAVAFVGAVLGIKPILHVNTEGKLVNVSKVRGRKAALEALVNKYGELVADSDEKLVYICHSDCQNDADAIKSMLNKNYGVQVEIITEIGPVIGAHSGPGTLAVFFIGKEK